MSSYYIMAEKQDIVIYEAIERIKNMKGKTINEDFLRHDEAL